MVKRVPWVMCLVMAFAWSASAGQQVLDLRPAETRVRFTLGSTLHTVHGTIPVTSGRIVFDLEAGTASGRVALNTRGTETGKESRDKKMHGGVLESETYPEIVFSPRKVAGTIDSNGSGVVTLTGTVAIHGGEHPISVLSKVTIQGTDVTATGAFRVPYVAWGMEDPSVFVLRADKHVEVSLEVRGRLVN